MTTPPTPDTSILERDLDRLHIARVVGAGILALAALGIWFSMAPAELPADSETAYSEIQGVLDTAESNEATAQGAPQQQVVNGWVARDLLAITAVQGTDQRPAGLILVGVLALTWGIATSRPSGRSGMYR